MASPRPRVLAAALSALLLFGAGACGDDGASRDNDGDGGVTDPGGVDPDTGNDSSTTVPTVDSSEDLTDDMSEGDGTGGDAPPVSTP